MSLQKLIDKKSESAQYMIDEITHICKDMPKRAPGTEGEKIACEYMAEVLKNDCGCERVDIEAFEEHPGSFYGWLYFTLTFMLIGFASLFFLPILGLVLITLGFIIMILQFGIYKKFVDCFFPKKTSHNVTAIKKCSGEVKRRIFFNGHPDATWNWPVNCKFGGKVYEAHLLFSFIGGIYVLILSIVAVAMNGAGLYILNKGGLFIAALCATVFIPLIIGLYFMWDKKTVVDGANDNLTGCYNGIALLKALKDEGITLENTEVGVILSGSEEAGLRGAKAWCEQHKGEFDDVPTWIYSFDTIHDSKFLAVNYRDLNATVKADKEVSDAFIAAAEELGIKCGKSLVPPFGGATDAAAFTQAGFKSTGITALNHVLENYYHTIHDTPENLNKECMADCYAITVKTLENFDAKN